MGGFGCLLIVVCVFDLVCLFFFVVAGGRKQVGLDRIISPRLDRRHRVFGRYLPLIIGSVVQAALWARLDRLVTVPSGCARGRPLDGGYATCRT